MRSYFTPASRLSAPLLLLACILALAASCEKEGNPILKNNGDLVAYIRAQTPTELPPVTQTGANTMGAYIHTDTGRVLFVASGIERPDPIGAESTDCPGWQNSRDEAAHATYLLGTWCRRPEIGDSRLMALSLAIFDNTTPWIAFIYSAGIPGVAEKIYGNKSLKESNINITLNDRIGRRVAGIFSATVYNEKDSSDSLTISDGRFDMRY